MDPTMGMFDSLKYDHENDKDGTQMKANVIGRYIGLASTLVIIGMGALAVMPQENSSDEETVGGRRFERVGASLDSTISNCGFGWDCGVSLLPFRRAPPPPPEESSKSIDMMCALMALVGALLCWVICNVEMYHYTLPLEKLNDEDAAGEEEAPEDEEPESSDEEEDDGKKKKKKGKCRHRIRKCCYNCCLSKPGMKQIYENFCYRGGCYCVGSIPLFMCKTMMVGMVVVIIVGSLFAFAKWRGEQERELDEPISPPESSDDEDESKQDLAQKGEGKKRKKKK